MFTDEQAIMLAALEQKHGRVVRLADELPLADHVLSSCLTGTRAYFCKGCGCVLTIEPDGEMGVWERVGD